MTDITPTAAAARESAREATGQFGTQEHTAPEADLTPEPPVTAAIAEYLTEYDAAQESYSSAPSWAEDDAYESWEDFQTDNSGRTYAMLETAKAEIERLQAELDKRTVPEKLRERILAEHDGDEPALFVPEDGHQDGYYDVIARTDDTDRKYTMDPDGDITRIS